MKKLIDKLHALRQDAATVGKLSCSLADEHDTDLNLIGVELLEMALAMDEMLLMSAAIWRQEQAAANEVDRVR